MATAGNPWDRFGHEDPDDLNLTTAFSGTIPSLKRLDFWDGNVQFDVRAHISPEARLALDRSEQPTYRSSLETVIHNQRFVSSFLTAETSLPLAKYTIAPQFARTRHTIDEVLANVARKSGVPGKVALPIPNWTFWATDGAQKKRFSYQFMDVSSGDELVDAFARNAREVQALLLVNPANPLGYSLTPQQCHEVDSIAQKNGVAIVIDEVLRGNQPLGKRESFGIQFSEPIVIEGFSHRFGKDMKQFAYALLPQRYAKVLAPSANQFPTKVLSEVYANCNTAVNDEIARRNAKMEDGFFDLDIKVERAADTHATSMLYLPKNTNLTKMMQYAAQERLVTGTIKKLIPEGYQTPSKYSHAMRVSVGVLTAQESYDAATRLTRAIRSSQE